MRKDFATVNAIFNNTDSDYKLTRVLPQALDGSCRDWNHIGCILTTLSCDQDERVKSAISGQLDDLICAHAGLGLTFDTMFDKIDYVVTHKLQTVDNPAYDIVMYFKPS